MKMKKLVVLAALLAVGTAQADILSWGGGANAGGTTDYNNGLGWYSLVSGTWGHVPALTADTLYIEKFFAGGAADTSTWIPTLNAAGFAGNVVMSANASASGTQIAQLDLVNGAVLTTDNMQMGAGTAVNSVNTVNMTGNATLTVGGLWIGSLAAGTDNTINLSDTSAATVTAGLWWGQDNGFGTGAVVMDGGASLQINTLLVAAGWENSRITALNAGDSILRTDLGTGYSEYTVIPEPATLGLFGLIGGGMLWIRKRSMI